MIENVELTNFISHKQTSLRLEDGVNVFIGANGAGKSSIVDAVTYALYGEHTRDANKNLLRRGAAGGSVSVRFGIGDREYLAERRFGKEGKLEGATFRELSPVPRLIVAGERRQYEESMSDEVAKAFGLDYEKMRVAAIVQQGELDTIIRYKPKELKELINSLIGIDRLDLSYQSMYKALEGFRLRLRSECMNYDDQTVDALKAEIQNTSLKQEEAERGAEEAAAALAKLEQKRVELEGELALMEPLRAKKGELEGRKRDLFKYVTKRLSEMEIEGGRLRDVISKASKYLPVLVSKRRVESETIVLDGERRKLEDSRTALTSDLRSAGNAEERIKKLRGEIGDAKSRIKDLTGKLKRRGTEIGKLKLVKAPTTQTQGQLALRVRKAEQTLDACKENLTKVGEVLKSYKVIEEKGVCPTCGSSVEEINLDAKKKTKHEEHLEASAKYNVALKEMNSVQNLLDQRKSYDLAQKKMGEQSEFYREQAAILTSERKKLASMKREVKTESAEARKKPGLQARLRSVGSKLTKLGEKETALRHKRARIVEAETWLRENDVKSKADVGLLGKKLGEVERTIDSVPKDVTSSPMEKLAIDDYSSELVSKAVSLEMEASKFDEAAYAQKRNELEERIRPGIRELTQKSGGWESQETQAREQLAKLNKAKTELDTATSYVRLFERIRNEVYNRDGVLATSLRSWALKELSRNASDYVRSFGIGLSELQLKEQKHDVNIECYSTSGMADVKSMSGGEGVAIALGIRFAMARLMGKGMVDFVVLDEPTTHLDVERKRSLVRLVTEFNAPERRTSLNQIIVITHDKEIFEDSEVNAVFQFEKSFGITTVTKS